MITRPTAQEEAKSPFNRPHIPRLLSAAPVTVGLVEQTRTCDALRAVGSRSGSRFAAAVAFWAFGLGRR